MSDNYFKEKNLTEYTNLFNKLTENIKDDKLYHRVISFLQHDEWYTKEQLSKIADLAKKYSHFTKKQLNKINYPPPLHCDDGDDRLSYCLYNDSNGILDIARYQGHGEWDMSPGAYM